MKTSQDYCACIFGWPVNHLRIAQLFNLPTYQFYAFHNYRRTVWLLFESLILLHMLINTLFFILYCSLLFGQEKNEKIM